MTMSHSKAKEAIKETSEKSEVDPGANSLLNPSYSPLSPPLSEFEDPIQPLFVDNGKRMSVQPGMSQQSEQRLARQLGVVCI